MRIDVQLPIQSWGQIKIYGQRKARDQLIITRIHQDVETHDREVCLKALGKLYLWLQFLFEGQMVALDPFLFLS